jgi:hypothetical protein
MSPLRAEHTTPVRSRSFGTACLNDLGTSPSSNKFCFVLDDSEHNISENVWRGVAVRLSQADECMLNEESEGSMADDCRDSFSTNLVAHLFCGDGVVYVTQQRQWSSAMCLTIQLGGTILMVPPPLGFAVGKKLEPCHHKAR